jgi:hypothetical protein
MKLGAIGGLTSIVFFRAGSPANIIGRPIRCCRPKALIAATSRPHFGRTRFHRIFFAWIVDSSR